jgi:RNA-directed DNA polymerase
MTRLGLALNEAKTSIKQARSEHFDFLGYTFGPHHFRKAGLWHLGASPSKWSLARLRRKVGDILIPSNVGAWQEVHARLNGILLGWSTYFSHGTRLMAYRPVDYYVRESVRHFLRRRHRVQSRGAICFSDDMGFGELGVLRLRLVQVGSLPSASNGNQSESRMQEPVRPVR